jgi:hypothetical protein
MPRLLAADEHRGADGEWLADRAGVDQPPSRLVGTAEEDVGRAREPKTSAFGLVDERGGFLGVGREGFLRIDVLASRERLADHGRVHGGRGQVEDDVDRRVADELGDRDGGKAVLLGEGHCLWGVQVGARDELERVERLRVLGVVTADDATPDDTDARRAPHTATSSIAPSASNERRAASSEGPSVSSCSTSSHSTPASTAAGATRS